MNVLVFDIETIPDVDAGRRLHGLEGLSDADVVSAMFNLRRQENGTEFLRLHLQRVVAISAVLRRGDSLKVWSLGEADSPEKELIQRFFDGVERFSPTLVSWNGCGFDLPVLHYRALLHGVQAPRYWETGDEDQSFRWNNYLSRYHARHTDLMDVLSGYQGRACAPLDEIATMLGFPGKMG
ncbi:MAG: 3'-5' exonuclease, partial [Thiohalomonadaceae bacterium]